MGVALVYYAVTRATLWLSVGVHGNVMPFWPAGGLGLGFFLLEGPLVLPAVWISDFAVTWPADGLLAGAAIACAAVLELLLARALLKRVHFDPTLGRVGDGVRLAGASLAAGLTSATVAVSALWWVGVVGSDQFAWGWVLWLLRDNLGIIVCTPLVLVWSWRPPRPAVPTSHRVAEASILAVLAGLTGLGGLGLLGGLGVTEAPYLYLVFPFVIWAGLRFQVRGVSALVMFLSVVTVAATARDVGPLAGGSLHTELIALHTFVGVVALTGLLLALATEEHQRDTTARTRLEAQRNALASQLGRLYQLVPGLIYEFVIRPDGTSYLPFASDAIRHIFGLTPDEVRDDASSIFRLIHPDDLAGFNASLQQSAKTLEPWHHEFRIGRADGDARWLGGTAMPESASNGNIVWYGFIGDVTARRQAQEGQRQLERALVESAKMESLGRLAGGVAHDFNNLLTVINGHSELMLDLLPAGVPLAHHAAAIGQAGDRAAALTRRLLALSRTQVVGDPHPLDLDALLADNRDLLQRLVGERIALDIVRGHSGCLVADAGQIYQVILNLVVNARDAMPDGGRITIATGDADMDHRAAAQYPGLEPGSYIRLTVADTGPGISPDIQHQIFDPFFTTKPVGEGTGLGLSIVYGIVRQYAGTITLSHPPGHGAMFTLHFPRVAGIAPAQPVVASTRAKSPRGTETILVVDDQPLVRGFVVETLMGAGYRVLDAAESDAAIVLATRNPAPIQLLVTDVVMPGLTGPQLADRLRQSRPEVKVLYMSGHAPAAVEELLLASDVAYLAKPFTPAALTAKVRDILDQSRAPAILIVDDDEGVRSLFEAVLVGAGYDVSAAVDGEAALALARRRPFDVVVTDLVMPEREGIDLIRTLRRECPHVHLVAMSGAFDGRFLPMAKSLGADATLAKPVSPDQLLATIKIVTTPE